MCVCTFEFMWLKRPEEGVISSEGIIAGGFDFRDVGSENQILLSARTRKA